MFSPALCILLAGIAAGLHAGKLPPAMPELRDQFAMTLVQVSLMVSLFQVAGMTLGIVGGMFADRFGARRMMTLGLAILGSASLLATASQQASTLLASRMLESAGFVLAVLPGTVLLKREIRAQSLSLWLGIWGTYMPTGMALALLGGPWVIALGGWRLLWAVVGALTLIVALLVRVRVDADAVAAVTGETQTGPGHAGSGQTGPGQTGSAKAATARAGAAVMPVRSLIGDTLRAPGPWLLALGFGCYAAQWMSVFSFLPSIYQAAGVAPALAGLLTALAVAINVIGNIASGWLIYRRVPPPLLLMLAGLLMALASWSAFGLGAPFAMQYLSVIALSVIGGLIPGTSFVITPQLAPHAGAVATTAGLMQQGSMIGQFLAPPLLALVASGAEGWSGIWRATALFASGNVVAGLMLWRLMRRTRLPHRSQPG